MEDQYGFATRIRTRTGEPRARRFADANAAGTRERKQRQIVLAQRDQRLDEHPEMIRAVERGLVDGVRQQRVRRQLAEDPVAVLQSGLHRGGDRAASAYRDCERRRALRHRFGWLRLLRG